MPQFGFGWEASKLVASLAIFLLSGLLEIIGGWFVWRAVLGGGGESSDETAAIEINSTSTASSPASSPSWRGFPTPARTSPSRLWLLVPGVAFLVIYGFIPTLQTLVAPSGGNSATFGRVFAVYGGFFILLSYFWGWLADGAKPDGGDAVGASVAIAGVLVAWFWPRVRTRG
jgi:small multidrug resistance family-3 protein